jgi:NADP-dependent 3-hydroxy acid dehydrogenase YdfG
MELAGRRAMVTAPIAVSVTSSSKAAGMSVVRVHAGSPNTDALAVVARHGQRVMPVQLDVTDRDDIREAARRHDAVDLLGSDTGEPYV